MVSIGVSSHFFLQRECPPIPLDLSYLILSYLLYLQPAACYFLHFKYDSLNIILGTEVTKVGYGRLPCLGRPWRPPWLPLPPLHGFSSWLPLGIGDQKRGLPLALVGGPQLPLPPRPDQYCLLLELESQSELAFLLAVLRELL